MRRSGRAGSSAAGVDRAKGKQRSNTKQEPGGQDRARRKGTRPDRPQDEVGHKEEEWKPYVSKKQRGDGRRGSWGPPSTSRADRVGGCRCKGFERNSAKKGLGALLRGPRLERKTTVPDGRDECIAKKKKKRTGEGLGGTERKGK